MKIKSACSLFSIAFVTCSNIYGQSIGRSINLRKYSIAELQHGSLLPQQPPYQNLSTAPANNQVVLGGTATDIQNIANQQAHRAMYGDEAGQHQAIAETRQDLRLDDANSREEERLEMAMPFKINYGKFLKMDPEHFSVKEAIYLCESAWYYNPPSWVDFKQSIKARAELVRQLLKSEGLSNKDNTALNYGIQKLFSQDNEFINPNTRQKFTVPRLSYDFNDYSGDRDWTNMFVMKLIAAGKGQCHSMPLLYLALAEELGARAYLSLSPQHSFIQYFDKVGRRYNFETTNGNLVTPTWLMQSTYVNATALKNKIYLDTLSSKQLYAELLSDMLQNYVTKLGFDDMAVQIKEKILAINPVNMAALMMDANYNSSIAMKKIRQAGYPPVEKLGDYPDAYDAYKKMQQCYQLIEDTGYQDIPKEEYQRWLQTADEQKSKQENMEVQKRLKKMLKGAKTKTLTIDRTTH